MDNNTKPLIDLSLLYGIHSNDCSENKSDNSSSYSSKTFERQTRLNKNNTNSPINPSAISRTNIGAQTIPPENISPLDNTSMITPNQTMMESTNETPHHQVPDDMRGLYNNSFSVTPENVNYLTDFMRTQSGKPVIIDFIVGNNSMITEPGILIGVGNDYILIYNEKHNHVVACDSSDIKFVRFPQ